MFTNAKLATLLTEKGQVEHEDDKFNKPGLLWAYAGNEIAERGGDIQVPDHIKANLDKAAEVAGPFEPRGSLQTWEETLYNPLADGTAVTGSSEATIFPIFTFPANYFYPGRAVRWTIMGRQSTAITTPGTITFKLSYSATGLGAVTVFTSGAFAPDPTAAATNLTFMLQCWCVTRTSGTSGTMLGWGRIDWSDFDDASVAALVGNLNMTLAPTSAPATVSVDTTVARALNPTYTSSVATASMTGHAAFLEAIT